MSGEVRLSKVGEGGGVSGAQPAFGAGDVSYIKARFTPFPFLFGRLEGLDASSKAVRLLLSIATCNESCAQVAGEMPESFFNLETHAKPPDRGGSPRREFVGWMLMPHFTPNKTVRFQGRVTRIEHVVLREGTLLVKLAGIAEAVLGELIDVEPSRFVYRSQVEVT